MDEKQSSNVLAVIADLELLCNDMYVSLQAWEKAYNDLKTERDKLIASCNDANNELANAIGMVVLIKNALTAETNRRIELEKQLKALKSQKRAKNGRFK